MVLIILSCRFLSYRIRSCVSIWTVPKSCPFIEKTGKLQNWSATWNVMGSCCGPLAAARWYQSHWGGLVRHRAAPLAREGEDAKTGGIPVRIGRQKASGLYPPYPSLCPCQLLPVDGRGGRSEAVVGGCGCRGSRFRGQHNKGGGVQEHLQRWRQSHPRR
jgi:hypothetical protein